MNSCRGYQPASLQPCFFLPRCFAEELPMGRRRDVNGGRLAGSQRRGMHQVACSSLPDVLYCQCSTTISTLPTAGANSMEDVEH
mmetsp:Transcript_5783/g.13486  ORF Transcript_5783/g.13486 Transcript_5783/m.13486 type:complete len:84 (-) Transcript_5783:1-252(-)